MEVVSVTENNRAERWHLRAAARVPTVQQKSRMRLRSLVVMMRGIRTGVSRETKESCHGEHPEGGYGTGSRGTGGEKEDSQHLYTVESNHRLTIKDQSFEVPPVD